MTELDSFWKYCWEVACDWPWGTVISGFLGIVILIVVGFFIWGVYVALDSWFLPQRTALGVVVGKEYTPAHWVSETYLPDDWAIAVQVGNRADWISLDQEFYDTTNEGDQVKAWYVDGRVSGGMYLKALAQVT